jgi:Uma2 family endonuclease
LRYTFFMPRVATNTELLTFEQYLKLEEQQDIRHEFVDGFMFAMAGGTKAHNTIAGNIYAKARIAARAKPNCGAYMENVKLRTKNSVGYYPDVVVSCDDDVNDLLIHNPCLIVEVLSSSTEDLDRSEKWLNYQKSSSLQMYVLINQNKKFLETFKRNLDGTWQYAILEETGTLEFRCLDFAMTLEEIYEDVKLEKE